MLTFPGAGRFTLSLLARTSPEALAMGESLARAAGALPLVVDAER